MIGLGKLGLEAIAALADSKTSETTLLALSQDEADLRQSKADVGILLSSDQRELMTRDNLDQIKHALEDFDVCFIVAACRNASEQRALVTISNFAHELDAFLIGWLRGSFECNESQKEPGLREDGSFLKTLADKFSIISVPPQPQNDTVDQATIIALCNHIEALSGLISQPGLIGVDYVDVRAILKAKGIVLAGMGQAFGENRVTEAFAAALSDSMFSSSKFGVVEGLLLNVIGGQNVGMTELETASRLAGSQIGTNANVLVGITSDPTCVDEIRVQLMLTGLN